MSTPSFGSHLNPILTRGGRLCPPYILVSTPSFESHRRACPTFCKDWNPGCTLYLEWDAFCTIWIQITKKHGFRTNSSYSMKGEKRRDMFNLDFRIVLVTSDSKTVTKRNRLVIKFFFDNFSAIRIMHFKLLFEHIFSLCTFDQIMNNRALVRLFPNI